MKAVYLLMLFLLILFFFSCSATTGNLRYSKKREKTISKHTGKRFTSDNDSLIFAAEFDEEPKEDRNINVQKIIKKVEEEAKFKISLSDKEKVMMEIVKYLNTPYSYGGVEKSGIDCSAFTQNVFSESIGFRLPRTASTQYKMGNPVKLSHLKFGDLLFFDTTKNTYPGHVGIYIGNNLFAHASFTKGVTISSIESAYYKKRFIIGKRIVQFK